MPNTPQRPAIDLQEVRTRNLVAREIVAALSQTMPNLGKLWLRLNASLDDTPRLVAEWSTVRRAHADLLAAARATLTAARDGERDHLCYLRDELSAQGHLPPDMWGRR
ncbi:hypothetical protein [Actinomadura keratinilytica]|uniref:Uncharacterized protein n=1 Tax=Actinomadura keratinilytica TaxID=547461 RepID=A0ABP7Z157_9ACTN